MKKAAGFKPSRCVDAPVLERLVMIQSQLHQLEQLVGDLRLLLEERP